LKYNKSNFKIFGIRDISPIMVIIIKTFIASKQLIILEAGPIIGGNSVEILFISF
jgi:hypothetical protein